MASLPLPPLFSWIQSRGLGTPPDPTQYSQTLPGNFQHNRPQGRHPSVKEFSAHTNWGFSGVWIPLWRWRWDLNPRRVAPSHAFEACSFGRSDTPPPTRLPDPEIGKPRQHRPQGNGSGARRDRKKSLNRSEHCAASTPATTSGRWLRRRSRTTSHNEPTAPAFGVVCPEDHPIDPGQHEGAGAHRAGLERDDERAASQPPLAAGRGCCAQRDELGVPGRVAGGLAHVVAPPDDRARRIDDHGADRHVITVHRGSCLGDGCAHPGVVRLVHDASA